MDEEQASDDLDLPPYINISTLFSEIFRKGILADIKFAVRENKFSSSYQTFSGHRLVLSLWSPCFADLFYTSDQEAPSIIKLDDVDPTAFQEVLKFMYGHPPVLESPALVFKIYKIAVKFKIFRLIDISFNRLSKFVPNTSNVFHALEVANYIENEDLKNRCLLLIKENTKDVLGLHSGPDHVISPDIVNTVLSLNELSLESEADLLMWLFTWAKNEFVREQMYSSPREVIIDYFPKLDFLSLTSEEFVELFKSHEGMIEEKEAFSILMNIVKLTSWPMPEWFCGDTNFRTYIGTQDTDNIEI